MSNSTTFVTVQIERILHFKPDSRWGMYKTNPCATGEGESTGVRGLVCKGISLFDVKEGDRLKLEGYFKRSDFSGNDEFTFRAAMPSLPVDLAALLHYAVEITIGLGEHREAQIWAKYGEDWITRKTLEITGVTEKVQFAWADTLRKLSEQAAQTQAASFLMSRGCTLNMANVAWKEWQGDTIGKVNANFYDLAQLPHYGFSTVDEKIRPYFDIADDDPRRRAAAILYVIGKLGDSGDTLIPKATVKESVAALVPCDGLKFAECIAVLIAKCEVVEFGEFFALHRAAKNEQAIFERFKR